MSIMQFLLIIAINFLFETKGDWVDPMSMDSNIKEKIKSLTPKAPDLSTTNRENNIKCESDLHLRRIVRLILNNAHLDNDMSGHLIGHLNIKLSSEEYEFLLNFSQSDNTKNNDFGEVSSVFELAVQKTSIDKYKEIILTFQEELFLIVFNPTSGALAAASLLLYVIFKLLRAQFTWRSILKYLAFMVYVADFIITYLQILRKEEIDNMVTLKKLGTVPPECDPQKLSWWAYMKTQLESAMFENPCTAYYQAAHQNYRYLVPPAKVFTRQFKEIIVEPVGDMGEAFGKFGRGLFTSLPWGLNVVIFPIMMITTCAIIFMVFLFITKPHFKISVFHLFTVEIGQPIVQPVAQPPRRIRFNVAAIRGNNEREVAYDAQHRAIVEDVSNDISSSNDDGQEVMENLENQDNQLKIGANEECDNQTDTPDSDAPLKSK